MGMGLSLETMGGGQRSGKAKTVDESSRAVQALVNAGILVDRRGSTLQDTPLLALEASLDSDEVLKAKVNALEHTITLLDNPTQVRIAHRSSLNEGGTLGPEGMPVSASEISP
jgi:hypothetical protein